MCGPQGETDCRALAEGVQKATCVQAMYERGQQGILMAAPVDPRHLRPLVRGLPDALKIDVQSLRERIQGAAERKQQSPRHPPATASGGWWNCWTGKLGTRGKRWQPQPPPQEGKLNHFAALQGELEELTRSCSLGLRPPTPRAEFLPINGLLIRNLIHISLWVQDS